MHLAFVEHYIILSYMLVDLLKFYSAEVIFFFCDCLNYFLTKMCKFLPNNAEKCTSFFRQTGYF